MRKWPFLLALLLTGCHDKAASVLPTAPSRSVPVVAVSVPPVPVIDWDKQLTAAHAGGSVAPKNVTVSAIEIVNGHGHVVARPKAGEHFNFGDAWGWYWVRGQVNGQWSVLVAFLLTPNPCGGCAEVPPVPPPALCRPDYEPQGCD